MVPALGKQKRNGSYGICKQLHIFIWDLCSRGLGYLYMVLHLFALLIPVETLPTEAGPKWIKALLSEGQCIHSSSTEFLKAFLHQNG